MRCTATFTIQVAPPRGVYVENGFQPIPFEVQQRTSLVRVTPEIVTELEELRNADDPDGPPMIDRQDFLRSLRVEAEHDAKTVPPAPAIRAAIANDVEMVLRAMLASMKQASWNADVDVRLSTLALTGYTGPDGTNHFGSDGLIWWSGLAIPDFWQEPIGDKAWEGIVADASTAATISLELEWILDALSFHQQGSYDLAIVAAAVAMEASLKRVLIRELVSLTGVTEDDASEIIRDLNLPRIRRWLSALGLMADGDAQAAERVAARRNRIVHGHHRQVNRDESAEAIRAAQRLQSLLSSAAGLIRAETDRIRS